MIKWTKERLLVSPQNSLKSSKCLQEEDNKKRSSFCPWVPERFKNVVFSNLWRQGYRVGLKTGLKTGLKEQFVPWDLPPYHRTFSFTAAETGAKFTLMKLNQEALDSGTLDTDERGGEPQKKANLRSVESKS